MTPHRVLLPVAESRSLRRTVADSIDRVDDAEDSVTFVVVYVPSLRTEQEDRSVELEEAEVLLDRVASWIVSDSFESSFSVEVETDIVGTEVNLYSPLDVAEVLLDEVSSREIDTVVFDPLYDPGGGVDVLDPVERVLAEESDALIIEADVEPRITRPRLPRRADLRRYALVFGLTFVFYLILAGEVTTYELVTGVVTAGIVTVALGSIALWQPPALRYSPMRALRAFIYIPYLLVMIIRANLSVARVILDPRLPIEPQMVRYHPTVHGPFPLTTLANSITLTPGTLSVRVVEQELLVHTLTEDAREDLIEGRLERAVRFLFFGRRAMRVASPRERGDVEFIDKQGDRE